MKKRISKKSLHIQVEALQEKNQELQRQLTDAAQWERMAIEYSAELKTANHRITILQDKLSRFARIRGKGGKFVKENR